MEKDDLADDLLTGVEAIATYTGQTKRAVYGLAEKGRLPVFKLDGWKWCARKSTLTRDIDKPGGEPCVIDRISAKRTRSPGNCCGMGLLTHG